MRSVRIAIVIAGVLSVAALLTGPDVKAVANLGLDDHETSWPDHEDVQAEAVSGLAAQGVAARARPDRSTVEVTGDDLAALESAIETVVSDDGDPTLLEEQLQATRAELEQASSEVEIAMAGAEPVDRIVTLADAAVDRRSALADLQIAAESIRSRFVSMGPGDPPEQSPVQWALAIGLIVVAFAARLPVTRR